MITTYGDQELAIVDPDIHFGQEFFFGLADQIQAGSTASPWLNKCSEGMVIFDRLPTKWRYFGAAGIKLNSK